jgi:hypothetical protein
LEAPLTSHTPRPVVSGVPYRVRQVHGRVPRELTDFAGQALFVLTVDGEDYEVRGPGIEIEGVVRVFEKDDLGHGKDIRVWTVRRHADGDEFTAEHAP